MVVSSQPGLAEQPSPGDIASVVYSGIYVILISTSVEGSVEGFEDLPLRGYNFLLSDGTLLMRSNHKLSPKSIEARYKVLFSVQKESG